MKLDLLIFAIVIASMPCKAQLTSEVDLGGGTKKSDSASEASTKEITVTGIGTTLESAEKQALASAIRQAVGAYMDSKTIVENEEVIQDRILSVSNAFVDRYEVVGQPKKSSDGLIQITVIAMVKANQVLQALKQNNLISADIAGENLWAEAATKVQNTQDSLTFLNEKLPELLKTLIKLEFLDKNGNPTRSIKPADQIQNAEEITATWYVRLSVDQKTYFKNFAPVLVKCLQNITGVRGEKFQIKNPKRTNFEKGSPYEFSKYFGKDIPFAIPFLVFKDTVSPKLGEYILCKKTVFIIEKSTLNFDFLEGTLFKSSECQSVLTTEGAPSWALSIDLLNINGELLAKGSSAVHEPFSLKNDKLNNGFNRDSRHPKGSLCQVGPFVFCETSDSEVACVNPVYSVRVHIPLDSMKDVKSIECKLDFPSDFHFKIEPAKS
jgi:hypothetical protein